jgi:hypothetical protein
VFGGNELQLTPLGYAQATIGAAAGGLPSIPPTGRARKAYITLEAGANGVRWRDDGTDPTAAVGTPLAGGATLEYEGVLAAFRAIRKDGADATLNVCYYG